MELSPDAKKAIQMKQEVNEFIDNLTDEKEIYELIINNYNSEKYADYFFNHINLSEQYINGEITLNEYVVYDKRDELIDRIHDEDLLTDLIKRFNLNNAVHRIKNKQNIIEIFLSDNQNALHTDNTVKFFVENIDDEKIFYEFVVKNYINSDKYMMVMRGNRYLSFQDEYIDQIHDEKLLYDIVMKCYDKDKLGLTRYAIKRIKDKSLLEDIANNHKSEQIRKEVSNKSKESKIIPVVIVVYIIIVLICFILFGNIALIIFIGLPVALLLLSNYRVSV